MDNFDAVRELPPNQKTDIPVNPSGEPEPARVSGALTDAQKTALLEALESLWMYGADRHPSPARRLNVLRESLGMPLVDYKS